MIIAVGSKSAAKVKPVEAVAVEYWGATTTVTGFDVESGVSPQPLGYEETENGAINRARNALKACPSATLAIGIEGGVMRNSLKQPILMNYIAITDGTTLRTTSTTGTPVPESWARALEAGEELRPLIMAMNNGIDRSAIGLLTNDTVKRDDTYIIGLRTALAPWLNPHFFSEDTDAQSRHTA